MWSDIDILMILASENIQTLAKLRHETLLEMPGGYGVPDGGGGGGGGACLYQLMFGSLRSALDFRGNMPGKSIRSILLHSQSAVSAGFVRKENSCPVVLWDVCKYFHYYLSVWVCL